MPAGSGLRPLRIDLDAGPVVARISGDVYGTSGLNFSTGLSLNIEDFFALTIRYETYRSSQYQYTDYSVLPYVTTTGPSRTNGTFYVGIKGGSYVGATETVIGGGVALALVLIFAGYSD
jgi:hypothetical protein